MKLTKIITSIIAATPALAIGIALFLIIGLSYDMKRTLLLVIPMVWGLIIVMNNYRQTEHEVKELLHTLIAWKQKPEQEPEPEPQD